MYLRAIFVDIRLNSNFNYIECFDLTFKGLQDYQAALKIAPDNEQIQKDADNIRQIIQRSEG